MEINILQNETALLGFSVIKLSEWEDIKEVVDFEKKIFNEKQCAYVYCQIPATDLKTIHLLEDTGFQFSEFRVQSMLKTGNVEISTRSFFPYKAELIGEEVQLKKAIKILKSLKQDDRFSRDTSLAPSFSLERNIANLQKSFHSTGDEFLLGIFNSQTDELLAFKSGAYLSAEEAHYYQYAVAPNFDFNHTADMLENFTIDYLKKQNIHIIHAISTGFNIAELNRLIENHNFKIVSSHVLMRKIFEI